MHTLNPGILKTKQHFTVLDGLRGVAALAVVVFHFTEIVYTDASKNFIAHGFLAVDFFFCLSGFVIAYAYDDRMAEMGFIEFFKSRLIRLHPLIILGSILGLLGFLFDPFSTQAHYSLGRTLGLFLCSIFLIPMPTMEERFFNLFGLNAPAWSLFWEYVANIVFALFLYKAAHRLLLVLVLISAVVLCYVGYTSKSLLGGWSGDTFWDGGARIFYSFLAGLLIFRFKLIIKNNLGFLPLSILLLLAFLMPYSENSWIIQLITVLFYFPLLVSLGAGTILTPGLTKLCTFSGNISYPLYTTHYFAMWAFGSYYNTYKPEGMKLALIIISCVVLLFGIAYVAMIAFDIPIRKYLTKNRLKG